MEPGADAGPWAAEAWGEPEESELQPSLGAEANTCPSQGVGPVAVRSAAMAEEQPAGGATSRAWVAVTGAWGALLETCGGGRSEQPRGRLSGAQARGPWAWHGVLAGCKQARVSTLALGVCIQ